MIARMVKAAFPKQSRLKLGFCLRMAMTKRRKLWGLYQARTAGQRKEGIARPRQASTKSQSKIIQTAKPSISGHPFEGGPFFCRVSIPRPLNVHSLAAIVHRLRL